MNRKRLLFLGIALLFFAGGFAFFVHLQGETCCIEDSSAGDNGAALEKGASGKGLDLALMTSLPLYWPLEASFEDIAHNTHETPWFRSLTQAHYDLVPLDTLSPIPALEEGSDPIDPMQGIERFALIQPRGLAPADNVALDEWVRAGGQLLLALDPALSGHYELPLGHPRFPTVTALIPPVVARWGLEIRFDDQQSEELAFIELPDQQLPVHLHGEIVAIDGGNDAGANDCSIDASHVIARCAIGRGSVTVLADAAVFEHRELAGEDGELLNALLSYAFAPNPR